jgi:hypothetical protein
MRAFYAAVPLVAVQILHAQVTLSLIHPGEAKVIGGTPGGGLVIGQTRCDEAGNIYFRQVQGSKFLLSPVVQISSNGGSSHIFDFTGIGDKDLRSFQVNDFSTGGSTLYLAGSTTDDGKAWVVEYSTSDGRFKKAIVLSGSSPYGSVSEGTLTISKLGVMPSGEFLIFGIRTVKTDAPDASHPDYTYKPVIELYDVSGRFLKSPELKRDDIDLNDKKQSLSENFRSVDLALTANGPDGIYIAVHSKNLLIYSVSAGGELVKKTAFHSPGQDYRPLSMAVSGAEALIQYVKSTGDNSEYHFVTYNTATGETLAEYRPDPDLNGIFACYDWKNEFKFISTNALGQRIIRDAQAR